MTVVTFGEAKGDGLLARLNPVLDGFGAEVAKMVKKGLTHKPTKWSQQFFDRVPAYFIEFTTTDKSDIEVTGEVNLVFDFVAGVGHRGLNYRVEVATKNAMLGPAKQKSEFTASANDSVSKVSFGILDRLQSQGNL